MSPSPQCPVAGHWTERTSVLVGTTVSVRVLCLSTMSYVGQFELFAIVNIGNGGLSLRHDMIVVNVVGQQTEFCRCGCINIVFEMDGHTNHNETRSVWRSLMVFVMCLCG